VSTVFPLIAVALLQVPDIGWEDGSRGFCDQQDPLVTPDGKSK
jgi:hypothetical protein